MCVKTSPATPLLKLGKSVRTQSSKLDATLLVSLKKKHVNPGIQTHICSGALTQLPFKKRSYSIDTESQNSTKQPTKRNCPAIRSVEEEPSPTIRDQNSHSVVAEPNPKESNASIGKSNVSEHDVLCGRGGATNVHPGNMFFRSLISKFRDQYLRSRKIDKPHISRSVVGEIRSRKGRFLKKNEKTGAWIEIGDDLAREKTSQALRQRAPDYRRQMMVDDQKRLFNLTSTPKKLTGTKSSMFPQSEPGLFVEQSTNVLMPLLDPPATPTIQTSVMNDHTNNYLMRMNGLSDVPRNHIASRELFIEYLAVKKREAELQHHLQMVTELKLKFGLGYM